MLSRYNITTVFRTKSVHRKLKISSSLLTIAGCKRDQHGQSQWLEVMYSLDNAK